MPERAAGTQGGVAWWQTASFWTRDPRVPLLAVLTAVTGVVDAVSYLALGRVFTANMTGNVVLLSFGLVRAPGVDAVGSAVALGAFLAGAVAGGRALRSPAARGPATAGGWPGRLTAVLGANAAIVTAVALAWLAAWSGAADPLPTAAERVFAALLAFGMGTQGAAVRVLGVPDLPTTVITSTATALAADSRPGAGGNTRWGRRAGALAALLAGAAAGAALVVHARPAFGLLPAVLILGLVAVAGHRVAAGETAQPTSTPASGTTVPIPVMRTAGASAAPAARAAGHADRAGAREVKDALAQIAASVCLVTTRVDGQPYGFTASSVTGVSLDPPLVLACLDRRAECHPAFLACDTIAVNVLAHPHAGLAVTFATRGAVKFAPGSFERGGPFDEAYDDRVPVLREAAATLVGRVRERIDAGDHTILLAEVERASVSSLDPLFYHQRRFRLLGPPAPAGS
jgi:flavin reductase (DIM6/NTAB) family NADH-FMN oxidoreductase RutF/uncharacterized membrane protein YoaK (UPF0700 family)